MFTMYTYYHYLVFLKLKGIMITTIIIIEIDHARIVDWKKQICKIGSTEQRNMAMTLLKRSLQCLKEPSNLGRQIEIRFRVIL